jgi:hypothetical protein
MEEVVVVVAGGAEEDEAVSVADGGVVVAFVVEVEDFGGELEVGVVDIIRTTRYHSLVAAVIIHVRYYSGVSVYRCRNEG